MSAGSATKRRQQEILSKLRRNVPQLKNKNHCLWRSVSQARRLHSKHKERTVFITTRQTPCRTHGLLPSALAVRFTSQALGIGKNSNVIWNDRFRRQSKNQSGAKNRTTFYSRHFDWGGGQNRWWKRHTSQRKILHVSFAGGKKKKDLRHPKIFHQTWRPKYVKKHNCFPSASTLPFRKCPFNKP